MTPEQIAALAVAVAPIPERERALIPAALARWRDNYRFRLVYLHLATQQPWWYGSAAQLSAMRRLAEQNFPEDARRGARVRDVPPPPVPAWPRSPGPHDEELTTPH